MKSSVSAAPSKEISGAKVRQCAFQRKDGTPEQTSLSRKQHLMKLTDLKRTGAFLPDRRDGEETRTSALDSRTGSEKRLVFSQMRFLSIIRVQCSQSGSQMLNDSSTIATGESAWSVLLR